MKAVLQAVKAAALGVVVVAAVQNTEKLIAKGGVLAGKAVATARKKLAEVRQERAR